MIKIVKCPVCKSEIELYETPEEGDVIYCQECGRELEVVSTHPLKLEPLEGDEGLELDKDDYMD